MSLIWILKAIIATLLLALNGSHSINNYLIFKGVFWNTIHQSNLYSEYPSCHFDTNHYGPVFSVIIAPFALMPNVLGCTLFVLANVMFLLWAIRQLPISKSLQNLILLIALLETLTAVQNLQFNIATTALIILSWLFVYKEKDWLATLCIVLGFMVKLYPIVGLAFFLFSKNKINFILWCLIWSLVFFMLPMLISSPSFIIQSYSDWYHSLVNKNLQNLGTISKHHMQNVSVDGMIKRITGDATISSLVVLIPAAFFVLLPLLRFNQYKNRIFQLYYLCMLLVSVVIFSTSAESSTYVIAVIGISIWYVKQKEQNKWILGLMIFMFIFTCISPTDLMPKYIKINIIRHYGLKALPCFMIWCVMIYQLLKNNFHKYKESMFA